MRKSLLTVLLLLGVQALIAQNIAVAKLRSETSRSIKKTTIPVIIIGSRGHV